MASKTNVTWVKREIRRSNMGKKRKAALRNKGTTPKFEIRSAAAIANAPLEQLTPAEREARAGK